MLRVWQVRADEHPFLARTLQELRLAKDRDPVETVGGDLAADHAAGPPKEDRPFEGAPRVSARLTALRRRLRDLPAGVRLACTYEYPAGGGLGWHTNSNVPGWRIYLALPLVPDVEIRSGLMLPDDRLILDRPGFAAIFRVTDWRYSWHAVTCQTPRRVAGFVCTDEFMAETFPALLGPDAPRVSP